MDDIDNKNETVNTQKIIVCDLGIFDWLKLDDGTMLVDYGYIMELQKE